MGCGAPVLGGLTPSTFPCRIHVTIDQAAPRAPEFVETLAGAIEVLTNGKLPRVASRGRDVNVWLPNPFSGYACPQLGGGLRARTLERKREATRAKIRARMNAVHLLVVSVPLEHCSELAYERIEKLAANMSASIMRQTSQYKVHGHFGLFNRAYRHVKTRFIWERLCSAKPPQTICETGFNAGLSALLMLEAAPDARLISFFLPPLTVCDLPPLTNGCGGSTRMPPRRASAQN